MSDSHRVETKSSWVYNGHCPTRQVLDRIADTWTVLIIRRLADGTLPFAQLRRAVDGISQKVVTPAPGRRVFRRKRSSVARAGPGLPGPTALRPFIRRQV